MAEKCYIREHTSEPESLGLPFPYLLVAQPAGSFHLCIFIIEKKSPLPDSRAPDGPIHNISLIIQVIQMGEDLSAEARSEGCRSPRRDAAHALIIGR